MNFVFILPADCKIARTEGQLWHVCNRLRPGHTTSVQDTPPLSKTHHLQERNSFNLGGLKKPVLEIMRKGIILGFSNQTLNSPVMLYKRHVLLFEELMDDLNSTEQIGSKIFTNSTLCDLSPLASFAKRMEVKKGRKATLLQCPDTFTGAGGEAAEILRAPRSFFVQIPTVSEGCFSSTSPKIFTVTDLITSQMFSEDRVHSKTQGQAKLPMSLLMLHMLLKAGEEEGQVKAGRDQAGGAGISVPSHAAEDGSLSQSALP
ncbi:hypothetical protein llap_9466 [Limosa lapponica baueri]|uniref:Uncharacterized protein n=1 Tax=Limosa lapponica baueri TaxID=1758121 RepID=A0A2I0U2Q0_LIMLA|nr:hypothetical protein llap_9466 [Limosa lapponica baueri]